METATAAAALEMRDWGQVKNMAHRRKGDEPSWKVRSITGMRGKRARRPRSAPPRAALAWLALLSD